MNVCKHKLYIHTGMSESPVDELRSILAQLHYTYHVRQWNRQGVPFCTHVYVPETDPVTGEEFHEREDHGHLLKVYILAVHICHMPILTSFLMFSTTENCHVHKRRKKSEHQPRALPRGSQISRNLVDNVCLEGWQEAICKRCRVNVQPQLPELVYTHYV